MNRKPYKRHENLDKMLDYLKKDNKQNFKEYMYGYKKVKDILQETGLPRHTFYTAIKEIDPDITEHKNSKKLKVLNDIYIQIQRSIPFEYLEFDVEKLFGRNNKYEDLSIVKKRNAVINKLNTNEFDINNIAIMSEKRIKTWYIRHCIKNDLLLNQETGYKIAKKYQVVTNTVFSIKKDLHQNKPLLKSIDIEQQNILLENIDIYNKSKKGRTVKELADEYDLKVWLVKVIIKYVREMIAEVPQN